MAKKAETPKLTFAELSTKPAGELAPFLVDTVKVYGALDAAKARVPDEFRTWLAGSIPAGARAYLVPGRKGRYDKTWKVIA